MPVVSIDRATANAPDTQVTAGGTKKTDAKSTPTFLSTESLTFPGVSLISLGLVQIWNRAFGTDATSLQIAIMAGVLGLVLIVWGLVGTTNKATAQEKFGQVIIGILNTILLYGVMLGVTTS